MSLALSELLNPAPSSGRSSPKAHGKTFQTIHGTERSPVSTTEPTEPQSPPQLQSPALDERKSLDAHLAGLSTSSTRQPSPPSLDQFHLSEAQSPEERLQSSLHLQEPAHILVAPAHSPITPSSEIDMYRSSSAHDEPETQEDAVRTPDFHPPNLQIIPASAPADRDGSSAPTLPSMLRSPAVLTADAPSYEMDPQAEASAEAVKYDRTAQLEVLDHTDAAEEVAQPEIKAELRAPSLDAFDTPTTASRSASTSTKKIEGLSSDKRYLCYICWDKKPDPDDPKLFTRRRSVRDHIAKQHPGGVWQPEKSIEVIVDPRTSVPIDPNFAQALGRPSPAPTGKVAEPTTEPSVADSRASSADSFSTPAPVIGKKRPPPSSSSTPSAAMTKKGTASRVKSGAPPMRKKTKTKDSSSINATPAVRSPSVTPVSSRASKTPAPKIANRQPSRSIASSPAPSESRFSVDVPDDEEAYTPNTNDDGDDQVFCVCRRGDDHTWMIACDGGCDDWFHGNCVDIQECDGDLIDKYICPNCKKEDFETTWKRLCRRKVCRKPARVMADPPSKYCSVECGRMFMVEMVLRSDPTAVASKDGMSVKAAPREKKFRKKKGHSEQRNRDATNGSQVSPYMTTLINGGSSNGKSGSKTNVEESESLKDEYETDTSADDEPLPSRGGALKFHEIQALIGKYKTIEEWRSIGQKPTAAPLDVDGNPKLEHSEWETSKLAKNAARKAELHHRITLLAARQTFLTMVKARSSRITEAIRQEKPKLKDLCGFDARLSWSEEEFDSWRNGAEGKLALDEKVLPDPPPTQMQDPEEPVDSDGEENEPRSQGVCIKNRCPRHRLWLKMQMSDIKFEENLINKEMDKIEKEEAGIKDRTMLRAWEKETK